jgi:hypothetical protein
MFFFKTTKLNSHPAQYEKKKSTKTSLKRKEINHKNKEKKNHIGKYYSNPQCFKEKKLYS